jgi:amino acid permease
MDQQAGASMVEQRRVPTRRPPWWMRIIAAVAMVIDWGLLIDDHALKHVLTTIVLTPLFLVVAIAPRRLLDGTFDAWARRNPVIIAGLLTIFCAAVILSVLTRVFGW